MRANAKRIVVLVICVICLALLIAAIRKPDPPTVIVPLADGTRFVLTATDSGRTFCFGGKPLQRMLSKLLGRDLPGFIHWRPFVIRSFYTNGIGLFLSRSRSFGDRLLTNWNGSGQLYYRDASGVERSAIERLVNFEVMDTGGAYGAAQSEQIAWELPLLHDPQLRLCLYETNRATGLVSQHDFELQNPAR